MAMSDFYSDRNEQEAIAKSWAHLTVKKVQASWLRLEITVTIPDGTHYLFLDRPERGRVKRSYRVSESLPSRGAVILARIMGAIAM